MTLRAVTVALLVTAALVTASPARADDPLAEVRQLQEQTSELHAAWDSLTPAQRKERLAELNRQTMIVQNDAARLPPEQQPEAQLRLSQVALELADLLRREWPIS